jgi:hypothetical protein
LDDIRKLIKIELITFPVVSFQDLNAVFAALIDSWVSFSSISGTFAIISWVEGLITGNVFPDFAETHFPFM